MSNEKAREFYNNRALKNHIKRAFKRDAQYFDDSIIEVMQAYADQVCFNSFQSEALVITENQLLKGEIKDLKYEYASMKERVNSLMEFNNQVDIECNVVKTHYTGDRKEGVLEGLRLAKVIFKELITNNQQSDDL